jgi:hypothetical protein
MSRVREVACGEEDVCGYELAWWKKRKRNGRKDGQYK